MTAFTLAVTSLVAVGTLYYNRGNIVRNHIIENPEIITEAITELQRRDMSERLANYQDALKKPFYGNFAGNPNGDVTLIELSDYNCGFCRRSLTDVERLLNEDANLHVLYKELPVLAESSQTAALWSLAAAKQNKYRAFHNALFNAGRPDDRTIERAANDVGLNIAKAQQDIQSEDAIAEINNNLSIMRQIGFSGTPTFIIGDEILEGAVGYEALKEAIERARNSKT